MTKLMLTRTQPLGPLTLRPGFSSSRARRLVSATGTTTDGVSKFFTQDADLAGGVARISLENNGLPFYVFSWNGFCFHFIGVGNGAEENR
ncbi:hypothetical protein [Accumulibacter sp.]|uniref:hypothetical protein n=1 Tax=Accumulibacter sp. TaxID=2053492 RepID=UPI0025E73B85|nr:hypothetical protein [Accumulibacter sp.]MCM8611936.1 hypothetical protein [Accumulibacter sp.]MCM8635558.1 hypothetical protein [Accumulibacter sp.]MCM8639136.1 hypothetical protein [Accumulibacter sp.]